MVIHVISAGDLKGIFSAVKARKVDEDPAILHGVISVGGFTNENADISVKVIGKSRLKTETVCTFVDRALLYSLKHYRAAMRLGCSRVIIEDTEILYSNKG